MSTRILASMLCLGAVAFTCGPHARKGTSSSAAGETALIQAGVPRTAAAPRSAHPAQKSVVVGQLFVRASDTEVRMALHVSNNSRKSVELTFPSGQTYDFVVLDSVGRELWRWSEGRLFTQALRNKLLSSGESLDYEASWDGNLLPPGRYAARAVLASENYPIVQQVTFSVTRTTVASR